MVYAKVVVFIVLTLLFLVPLSVALWKAVTKDDEK